MRTLVPSLSSALLLLVVGGCGGVDDAPAKYTVSGTVSFSGQPVSEGTILFMPEDGNGRPDGGPIKDGKFEFESTKGKKRVEIRASLIGEVKEGSENAMPSEMGMKTPEVTEMIPEKYNSKSELTQDVTTDAGKNKFEFRLE